MRTSDSFTQIATNAPSGTARRDHNGVLGALPNKLGAKSARQRLAPSPIRLHGRRWALTVGNGLPLRVSVALGANSQIAIRAERRKLLQCLNTDVRRPDLFVDLSTFPCEPRLFEIITESFGGPVGYLPHYVCSRNGLIDESHLLSEMGRALAAGVSYFTIHITPNRQLLQLAEQIRPLPTTSRGGGIVLDDLVARGSEHNVFQRNIPEILNLLKGTGVAISLGSTFRPASTHQMLDRVHIEETRLQNKYADLFLREQIPVIREGVGHGTPMGIRRYVDFLREQDIQLPFMALGPVATDHAGHFDVLAAGIGATVMSDYAHLGVIQTITCQEHSGGVPNLAALLDGLASARVVADIVNADRGYGARNRLIAMHRETSATCVTPPGSSGLALRRTSEPGCSRCAELCPLTDGEERLPNSIITALKDQLPKEILESALALYNDLRHVSQRTSSVVLFGSTAKDCFSYARVAGELRLQSDLEFNILTVDKPSEREDAMLEHLLCKYSTMGGPEQPLFDVDVRFRQLDTLSAISYTRPLRRELFCYALTDGIDPEESISTETDIVADHDLNAIFVSALEWALFRLAHISQLPANEHDWWLTAVWASLICKLAAVASQSLGVPFTSTPQDTVAFEQAAINAQERRLAESLRWAWAARLDRTARLYCEAPAFSEELKFVLACAKNTLARASSGLDDHPLCEDFYTYLSSVVNSNSLAAWQPSDNATITRLLRTSSRLRGYRSPFDIKFSVHVGEAV